VRDVRDSTRWDTRKRSHRATASAVSAVRAHTRDWCVRDRATDGRARDLDYSSSRMDDCVLAFAGECDARECDVRMR